MQLIPDNNGINISNAFTNNTYTYSFNYDISTSNIEDISDLSLITFIQDESDKEVLQSASLLINIETNTKSSINNNIQIYPNPIRNSLIISNYPDIKSSH